ncbi:UNVERIFIED_CONTAM: putative LRR receptor-like serine/threonine-protein kinase [Sesamum radiatum]|uniref:LRR receptor-like serine/threonine-protein kinase n=1 Tax=Sesamum radiatum TaxID=300843 RepID=A0AAW2THD4_SESRA
MVAVVVELLALQVPENGYGSINDAKVLALGEMGFGIFGSFLVLTLFFKPLVCQQPNTDESFVLEFLQKMGLNPPKDYGFSGAFCEWRGVFCDDKGENVVSNNRITGLPSDFWSLGSLKKLNLSHNQITGSLSSNMGNFGRLQSLDLSFNNLSGSIPEAISSSAVCKF